MRDPASTFDGDAIRAQVRRIAADPLFAQSDRLKQFLEHVTERALEGNCGELKESVLAMEIFGRQGAPERTDDSVVRVTASKVRSRLREYYLANGSEDKIVIELPKGSYSPVFHHRKLHPKPTHRNRWIVVAAFVIFAVAATAIGARLTRGGENASAYKTDPVTYNMYVEGSHYAKQFTGTGRNKSFEMLRAVIQRAPGFVPAYVTLAETLITPPQLRPPWEEASEARLLLAKALELAPWSAEAHTAMGILKTYYDWDWPAAEQYFRRAISLNPGGNAPHQRLAELLAYEGRADEAVREVEFALKSDPVSDRTLTVLALAYYFGRRFDQAVDAAKKNIEVHANSRGGHLILGIIYDGSGHSKEAITSLERLMAIHKDPAPIGYLGALGHAYAAAGRRDDAMRLLRQMNDMSSKVWVSPLFMARVYVGLGMKDQAIDLIERASEQHDPNMVWMKEDPRMDPIRSHPRYKAVLQRLRFK